MMETNEEKKLRPTFGGSFGHGWETMIKYFLILLLVVIITGIIMAPMNLGNLDNNFKDFNWRNASFNFFNPGFSVFGIMAFIFGIFALAYMLLIVPVFKFGGDLMFVHAARDSRPDFESLIHGFRENYFYIVLANLLAYLVMDKKMDPIAAVEESWRMTKGHGWAIFFMGIVSFFMGIVGLALLFVGILPAIMWAKSAFASLYEAVLQKEEAVPVAA